MVALNAEKEYAEEAKERQLRLAGTRPNTKPQGDLPQFSGEGQGSQKTESNESDFKLYARPSTTHTTSSKSTSSAKTKAKDKSKHDGEAAQQAAEAAGTNRDYVAKVKFLQG